MGPEALAVREQGSPGEPMQPGSRGVSQYLSTKSRNFSTLNNTQVETLKMSNTVINQSIFSWNIFRSQNDSFVIFRSKRFFFN